MYDLESTVELVKYHQKAVWLKEGVGVAGVDGFVVREAGKKLTQAIERQEPEKVIFHSCEAVFATLQALHNMGFDVSEFNSVFRDYVDYKFELITDSEEKEPDFKYDIPAECVFDNGFANPDGTAKKETVKWPYHRDNIPDFDDLIGNVIAKSKERSETK